MGPEFIHFIGGGGVGVNALARFALDRGIAVSASDARRSDNTARLRALGADVWLGEKPEKICDQDLVVYTEAISPDHSELVRARELGIRCVPRQDALGDASRMFKERVAIAGTHGKTTVTAMLTAILNYVDRSFISFIGGDSIPFGNYVNNSRGRSDLFVTEACEYRRSFLRLDPTIGVVTNIQHDHPDCYPTLQSAKDAFKTFLDKSRTKIIPAAILYLIDGYDDLYISSGREAQTCENSDRTYELHCISDKDETFAFSIGDSLTLLESGSPHIRFDIPEGGLYNQKNAAVAATVAYALGIDFSMSAAALKTFGGVRRRFERGGSVAGVQAYFDFAHHPTEIACALERASKFGRVLTIFQPHTYSRTQAFLHEFAEVLADRTLTQCVVLMPVYAAREDGSAGVDSDELYSAIFDKNREQQVYLAKNAKSTIDLVKLLAADFDVVMFIGAGDIYDLKSFLDK